MASETNQLLFIRSRIRFYREMIIYNDRLLDHIRNQNTVMETMITSLESELLRIDRRGDIVEAIRSDPTLAPPVLRRQANIYTANNSAFDANNSAFDAYNLNYNNSNNRPQ